MDSGIGAARGSAYHRALELLPFDRIRSLEDVDAWLTRFVGKKQYTSGESADGRQHCALDLPLLRDRTTHG